MQRSDFKVKDAFSQPTLVGGQCVAFGGEAGVRSETLPL